MTRNKKTKYFLKKALCFFLVAGFWLTAVSPAKSQGATDEELSWEQLLQMMQDSPVSQSPELEQMLLAPQALPEASPQPEDNEPLKITLTWTSDSFVPPGYPGRALPAKGSIIEVAVNIDSPAVNPETLVYNWYFNDQIEPEQSGVGKQVFVFKADQTLRSSETVNLKILDAGDNILAKSRRIAFKTFLPEAVIQGRTRALSFGSTAPVYQTQAQTKTELTAAPYYFNIKNPNELSYNWVLEGETEREQNQNLILNVGPVVQPLQKNLTVRVANKNSEEASGKAVINFIP